MNDNMDIPLSLYVHLPWCVSKCPYCDFNSHTAGDAAPRERYLQAVEADLASEARRAGSRPIVSIYFGGGTPSLFSGGEIGRLVEAIAAQFSLQPDVEISMEANPGTLEHGDLRDYCDAGINRLSLGAQSFQSESLKRLGRIHGPDEILRAYDAAVQAGFDSVNLDLMFALPGQDVDMAIRDVEQAIALGPEHISHYQLTLEPNTVFHSRPPTDLPDEDQSFIMQQRCQGLLAEHGYEQYEVSAFARAGFRCRHNLNYWTFGDYLAAGAGAHGKLTGNGGEIRRYAKPKHPLSFIEQAESGQIDSGEHEVSAAEVAFEFMLNALRLPEGFSGSDYGKRTGLPVGAVTERLAEAEKKGLLQPLDGPAWRPTALGLRFVNDLTAMFLP